MTYRWIQIEPGLIGLHGMPIQIRFLPETHLYEVLVLNKPSGQSRALLTAKTLAITIAKELVEMDVIEVAADDA